MKSFFALAVATTALAAVNAVDCDTTKLIPLLSDTDVKKCGADTGLQPPIPPTADVLPKLCGNAACQAALVKLKAVLNGDCVVAGIALESQFIAPIEKYCASNTTPAPATTAPAPGTSPSPTSATPKTPTPSSVAPTPTSSTPTTTTAPSTSKPSTAGSSPGSDTTIEENKNPINVAGSGSGSLNSTVSNSTTPTPSPKSGASSVALAASAVVLAVAAAFM